MPIKDYKEKEIRKQIIKKINPQIYKNRGAHQKGYIKVEGKVVTKVKIPNEHNKVMKSRISKYIATNLKLNAEEFNDLIDCPLTGPKYFDLLRTRITK